MESFVKFLFWAGKVGILIGVVKWANSLGHSVSEARPQDTNDADADADVDEEKEEVEEEDSYASGPSSKLQPRAAASKARWNDEMGMAEVLVQKGKLWKNTGIVCNGKLYCFIEEVLLMVENGALLLVDDSNANLSLGDIYTKISSGKFRCCWEEFRAYKELKSLGYIVGRHGIPWSVKKGESEEMQTSEARPVFYVYRPNSKFKKSCPGDPIFVLCFTKRFRGALEGQCEGIPLKFCNVEQGRVTLFSFDNDKVELLPVLP